MEAVTFYTFLVKGILRNISQNRLLLKKQSQQNQTTEWDEIVFHGFYLLSNNQVKEFHKKMQSDTADKKCLNYMQVINNNDFYVNIQTCN